jgi:hypothetical protein
MKNNNNKVIYSKNFKDLNLTNTYYFHVLPLLMNLPP